MDTDPKNTNPQAEEEQELFERFHAVADKGQEPLRIDKFLFNRMEKISRNRIQQAAKAGLIMVNGKAVKSNYKIRPDDDVSFVMPSPQKEFKLLAEDIPIQVIYEDESLTVIEKQAGLVVHPGHGNYTGTLVNGLMHHYSNLPDSSQDNSRPGLIHRLDKNTSGLMVVARDEFSMMHLAKQFFDRTIKRSYNALVWGDIEEPEGSIEGHIGRHLRDRLQMEVFPEADYGKYALTHYKTLKRYGYVTLMECRLETGRTHQIRVHFKHINHPLFNDERYGGDKIVKGTVYTKYQQFIRNCFKVIPRQALHARSLGFIHPVTQKEMFFESPLPPDFEEVLVKWDRYTQNLSL